MALLITSSRSLLLERCRIGGGKADAGKCSLAGASMVDHGLRLSGGAQIEFRESWTRQVSLLIRSADDAVEANERA